MRKRPISCSFLLVSLLFLQLDSANAQNQGFTVTPFANSPGWITVAYIHSGKPGALWYFVERQGGARSTPLGGPNGSWTDAGLAPNTVYTYRACAVYEKGDPSCSDWVQGRTSTLPGPRANYDPPIITSVTVGTDQVRLTWGATGDYSKVLARNVDMNGGSNQVELQNVPNGSVIMGNLKPGTPYKFMLKGCSGRIFLADSCGPWSQDVFVTTASLSLNEPPPSKPTIQITRFTQDTISLNFAVKVQNANAADRFHLYRDRLPIQEVFPQGATVGWTGSYTDRVNPSQRNQHLYHVCFKGFSPRSEVCSETVQLVKVEAMPARPLRPPGSGPSIRDAIKGIK